MQIAWKSGRLFPVVSILIAALCAPQAQAAERLELLLPGDAIPKAWNGGEARGSGAQKGWSAISLSGNVLSIDAVTQTTQADWIAMSGAKADRLLAGKPLRMSPKPDGLTMKAPPGTLLMMRLLEENDAPASLSPGKFEGSAPAGLLTGDWSLQAKVGNARWKFEARYEKRPDGKLLAGSLQLLATPQAPNAKTIVLLPPAARMAFDKQELLWLGDLNGDNQPDLLIKRTWVTGEIDYVVVVSPMFASAYVDPDQTERYFSSGVEPEGNSFAWNSARPAPAPIKFARSGKLTVTEDEWRGKLKDEPQLPVTLADRKFKLNGEDVRVILEYLPRAKVAEGGTISTSHGLFWGGDVLVKIAFRGSTQVLMQAAPPDSANFTLSIGLVEGKPAIKADYMPHYNNSFEYYWIYEDAAARFRRVRIAQSQGC